MAKDLFAFVILFGVVSLATGYDAIGSSDLEDAPGLGETKSAYYYSNTGYNGRNDEYDDDDEYDDSEYEDDDDNYGMLRINLSFNTQDTRSTTNNDYDRTSYNNGYDRTSYNNEYDRTSYNNEYDRTSYNNDFQYRNLLCKMCYQYCAGRGVADYTCDTNYCNCIPAQQTATNPNTYGPQKLSGNSCRGYFLQIGGRGLESTCEAFCKTIGLGKLIGVCIYNECTCEAMNQNDYPNGYSGHQQYNRYYRSVELSNDTLNVV